MAEQTLEENKSNKMSIEEKIKAIIIENCYDAGQDDIPTPKFPEMYQALTTFIQSEIEEREREAFEAAKNYSQGLNDIGQIESKLLYPTYESYKASMDSKTESK